MADFSNIAIVAGAGVLPRLLADAAHHSGTAYHVVAFDGIAPDWVAAHPTIQVAFEQLGTLFSKLHDAGITRLVFAGAMARPALDPARADAGFLKVAPQLMAALQQGDDATLRFVVSLFETQGFDVVGAHDLLPELVPPIGALTSQRADPQAQADLSRAASIVAKLGEADVGQGAVVAGGICLAVETIGGTDRMLDSVGALPAHLRGRGGVLVKAAKPGQDLRIDMPAIGPETVRHAAAAGLTGIGWTAGEVLVLERDAVVAAAEEAGMFLQALAP